MKAICKVFGKKTHKSSLSEFKIDIGYTRIASGVREGIPAKVDSSLEMVCRLEARL